MDEKQLSHLVENEHGDNQPDRNRKALFGIACQINRAGRPYTPEDVKAYATQFSMPEDEVEKMFKKVKADKEDEYGLDQKPALYKIEKHLNDTYDFALNTVLDRTEFRVKGETEWKPCNYASVWRECRYHHINISISDTKTLLDSDFVAERDPFLEYFESLPKWDGNTDYIDILAGHIHTTDDEWWREMFRKNLIRSVHCGLGRGENRYVMVLSQRKEATGKTHFVRFLNPFGEEFYTEEAFVYGKDSQIALAQNFIYNLEELDQLNPKELARMKAAISKLFNKIRKPFGRDSRSERRRANFWASTNEDQFLGAGFNSRWLVFNVLSIDWSYVDKINIHDVYAQAYSLYKGGASGQLTPDEIKKRDLANMDHRAYTVESDVVEKYLARATRESGQFKTVADITMYLMGHNDNLRLEPYRVATVLSQLGFIGDRKEWEGRRIRGYYVDMKAMSELDMKTATQTTDDIPPPTEEPGEQDELPF